jgi:hypothetical protein
MKTRTSPTPNSVNRSSRRCGTVAGLLIPLALAYFGLSPQARAVCQQGCDLINGNTFLGDDALVNNELGGGGNTAIGETALYNNDLGYRNTATGASALYSNVWGFSNTATGASALENNTTGRENTATGESALSVNVTGDNNTAIGNSALSSNVTADNNTAIGNGALYFNTGPGNVAVGVNAGVHLTTGNGNVCLGAFVFGNAGESNTTRIRNVYSSVASERAVYVTADNKIGTLVSSRRFKEEIKPMDKASEAILALKPVSFRYKKEIESNGSIMFGLIAEDVEKADPDLVTRDEKGQAETVRYEVVNAMLLNEFLKEHAKVEQLKKDFESKIAEQQRQIEALSTVVKEQTSQIQTVSAQLSAKQAAPRLVTNE